MLIHSIWEINVHGWAKPSHSVNRNVEINKNLFLLWHFLFIFFQVRCYEFLHENFSFQDFCIQQLCPIVWWSRQMLNISALNLIWKIASGKSSSFTSGFTQNGTIKKKRLYEKNMGEKNNNCWKNLSIFHSKMKSAVSGAG